jgi:hypothetical protein
MSENQGIRDMVTDVQELTPRERGLINAAKANRRRKEERLARELRDRGWTVISPYETH